MAQPAKLMQAFSLIRSFKNFKMSEEQKKREREQQSRLKNK